MGSNRLLDFVQGFARLIESNTSEEVILTQGRQLVVELVSADDWLPEQFTRPHPQYYQQYLLYADPLDRLSIVSFVWGPGQRTPLHDHLTWGIVGGLRGRERETTYALQSDGRYLATGRGLLLPGQTTVVSPTVGDVHEVANDLSDRVSISIHVYGRNIGRVRRHVFDSMSGAAKEFVSGYANTFLPNLWR